METVTDFIFLFEKVLESSLAYKKIKPANHKEISPDYFIGRTDAKTETLAT